MSKTHWTQVAFEDDLDLEQRRELLREYRETGSILHYYLAPTPDQADVSEPSDWGPAPDDIDWTGIEN